MRDTARALPFKFIGVSALHYLLIFILSVGVASAQEIPRLPAQITDLTRDRVLSRGQGQIETALRDLQERRNVQLWVLFLETTGGREVVSFAEQTYRQNSLGGDDVLLVVAVADRSFAFWRSQEYLDQLADRELQDVLTRRVQPRLQAGDFPGAVVGAAQGLGEVAGAGQSQPGGDGGGPGFGAIIGIIVLVVGGLWLWNTISRRRQEQLAAEERDRQTGKLAQQANALLIQADEALRAAQDETAYAELQFTEEELAPFRQAIAQASEELKAAFTIRQQLDDDTPESPDARRQMLQEIIDRAGRAQTALAEQQRRIEELRELEQNAPQVLAKLPAQLDALEARITEAQGTLAQLQQRYAEESIASVRGNLPEAEKRVAFARAQLERGQPALGQQDSAEAGKAARLAQQAFTGAVQLVDAIDALARSIQQAELAAAPQLEVARTDLATARAALAETGMTDLTARLSEGERAFQQAQAELAKPRPDFLDALRLATQAEAIADEIVAAAHQQAEQRARDAEILAAQLQVADSAYDRAAQYIAARHHGIGRAARTRLAEAERHLDQAHALAGTDVRAATEEARHAQRLADEAYRLAQRDFEDHDQFGTDIFTGRRRGGGGLFPLPIPIPSGGGGWSGGGFGGTPWGSGGGGFGGGGVGGGGVGGRW